ncbi:hypothetical protein SAMN05216406_1448 [Nitrosomonas ureae]|uniref:Uncharacterized protein n=1 Tax=Nitrosomonas ureae TaxID=44577 RepID=A0A1H2HA86_9PROT|nr:hypothetical protein SAMN05216406_1448 [Nitrosomonas ureae]
MIICDDTLDSFSNNAPNNLQHHPKGGVFIYLIGYQGLSSIDAGVHECPTC